MIDFAEAQKIAERFFSRVPDEDSVLTRSFGWLFCPGSVHRQLRHEVDERVGIGGSSLIVEKETGAAFSVDSFYSMSISEVLRAFEAGFWQPFYDLTITKVMDLRTTIECLASLPYREASAYSRGDEAAIEAALVELPKTFAAVDVWHGFGGIALIHEAGCCMYSATPTRGGWFRLTVTMINDVENTIQLLLQLCAGVIGPRQTDGLASSSLLKPMTKDQIRDSLESLPSRFIIPAVEADAFAALNSNTAFACVLAPIDAVEF